MKTAEVSDMDYFVNWVQANNMIFIELNVRSYIQEQGMLKHTYRIAY